MASCPLSIRDLCLDLSGQRILRNVSFAIGAGERVCLLGASGSGKSLTAGAIVGLLAPDARCTGRIEVAGCDVTGLRVPQRPREARVALVSQDSASALNPLVSIGVQLAEPLRRHAGLSKPEARQAALDLLRAVDLPATDAFLRTSPAEISGGQRQRVCIAVALACRTPLVVADEPTTALDLVTQGKVLGVLRERTGGEAGPALLLVTHDLSAASMTCERVLVLAEGRIVEDGPIEAILARPAHPFTRELVACFEADRLPDAA